MMSIFYPSIGRRLRKAHLLSVICLLAFGMNAQAQMSGSYTIDKNGTATATNFKSFQSAYQALKGLTRSDGGPSLGGGVSGPVTITAAPASGPYTEQLIIQAITGASSTNTITFDGSGEMIQYSTSSSSSRAVIKLDGADYFTFKNLKVKPTHSTYGWAFWLLNRADYNVIENCELDITTPSSTTTAGSAGIVMSGSATSFTSYSTGGVKGLGNIFRNNQIYGNPGNNGMYAGIVLNGSSSPTNQAHNTTVEGNNISNFYLYGIYSYYYHNGVDFIGNTIKRGAKPTQTTFYGIYSYYASNVKINSNYISDDAPTSSQYTYSAYGVYCYYPTTSNMGYREINNNTIVITNGYYLFGIYATYYVTSNKIEHNTIYIHPTSNYFYYAYGIQSYDYASNGLDVHNNIIDIEATSFASTTYNMYLYIYGTLNCENNVLPRMSNSMHYTAYRYSPSGGTVQATTLSDWQNNGGFDLNGTDIRPTYKDPATGDFEPTSIDHDGMGKPVGVLTDSKGNPRSLSNPDPGSIEFDIPINVSSITFPTTVCQNATTPITVDITNNSSLNLSNFFVQYEIDGVIAATEQYTGTINSGATAQFTFTSEIFSDVLGAHVVKAMVRGKNPVQQVNYQVNSAPVGSFVSTGSTFEGTFASGSEADPDIVAYGDNVNYSIDPPAGYTNADYNSVWTFDYWELTTAGGTSAGSSHGKTNPTSANANSSFTPVIGQSDSTFILKYALRFLGNGCVAPEVARTIFVAPRPVVSFTGASVCEGQPMQFVNNSTISSGHADYKWRFGDGDSTVLVNPSHKYSSAGTYDVELVAISNYGYEASTMVQVSVKESPMAEFAYTNQCEGTAIPFVDGTIIPSGSPVYSWDFGDGNTSAMPSPSHTYAQVGTYEVILSVTASGCTDKVTHFVTQAPRPTVSFSNTAALCNNEEISFTNNSSIVSGNMGYEWDFKDGSNKVSIKNPVHKFNGAGSFDVTLTARTDLGCVESYSSTITLIEGPTADFGVGSLCDKANISFTNNTIEPAGSTVDYTWNFGEGNTATTKDPVHSFGSMGMYDITLTATSDNGCEDVLIKSIDIGEMPEAEFYVDNVCEGEDVELLNASVASTSLTYDWNIGSGNTSTDENPVVSLSTGTHTIDLTVTTPQGCSDNISKTVEVKPVPVVTINSVTSGEDGEGTIVFSANTDAGADYIWFFGDGGKVSDNTSTGTILTTYQYIADGKYNVELRVTKDGCAKNATTSSNVSVTGLFDVVKGDLKVYPNPTNGSFTIALDNMNTKDLQVKIMNAGGQPVKEIKTNGMENALQVDLSTFADGVYFVNVQNAQGVYNTRITLQK